MEGIRVALEYEKSFGKWGGWCCDCMIHVLRDSAEKGFLTGPGPQNLEIYEWGHFDLSP